MPKETFFSLPTEKLEYITNVAIEEFASNEYANVSVSRLVAKAGIAKGSFYQYFEDKEDLFGYLLELILEKKTEMFSLDHPDPEHVGIFAYLRWLARKGVEFTVTYPKLTQVGYRAARADVYSTVFSEWVDEQGLAFYRRLVRQGMEQGDIQSDIDDDLAAVVFNSVFSNLGRYLVGRFGEEVDQRNGFESLFENPEFVALFDQAINILESGLGRKSSQVSMDARVPIQEVVK